MEEGRWEGSYYLGVADYSDAQDTALQLIDLMTDYQNQFDYHEAVGDQPCNTKAVEGLSAKTETVKRFAEAERKATPTPFLTDADFRGCQGLDGQLSDRAVREGVGVRLVLGLYYPLRKGVITSVDLDRFRR